MSIFSKLFHKESDDKNSAQATEIKTENNTQSVTPKKSSAGTKTAKGPDIIAMMNSEKEYALTLCERLEKKYGKAEFGTPLTENEIIKWESDNQVTLPDDLKEWLMFAGESRFKGITLEFYPIERFQIEQDHVVIGKKETMPIAFLTDTHKYIALDGENRKNLGFMETIIRNWGYDAKELLKDEELEKLRPVIEEETESLTKAIQKASMPGAGVSDAMECFLIKNNIGSLYKWLSFPKCPLRKDMVSCGLVISEPDREGYYQWKPKKQTAPVNFSEIESKLGFSLHEDIKALVSSYFYFMLEGKLNGKSFHIYGLLPTASIENYVIGAFDKEDYAGDYSYITDGHFFHLGGACINGDDSFVLEVNNDNGEVIAVEYMDKKHLKFADSLYELFMNSAPIWYKEK